jgi:hypothetical protein
MVWPIEAMLRSSSQVNMFELNRVETLLRTLLCSSLALYDESRFVLVAPFSRDGPRVELDAACSCGLLKDRPSTCLSESQHFQRGREASSRYSAAVMMALFDLTINAGVSQKSTKAYTQRLSIVTSGC